MKKADMEKEIAKLKEEISELKSQMLALSLRNPQYVYYYQWPTYTQPYIQPTFTQPSWTTMTGGLQDAISGNLSITTITNTQTS